MPAKPSMEPFSLRLVWDRYERDRRLREFYAFLRRALAHALGLSLEELSPSLWAAAAFAAGLGAYTVLKPLRDAVGLQYGADKLPWLFTATLIAMTVIAPAYAVLADRIRGRDLVKIVWRTVAVVQLVFVALFVNDVFPQGLFVCFFVWVSVFNFIVVSALWSWLTTASRSDRAYYTFGPIAFGGSAAALLGPIVARVVASRTDPLALLVLSAALLLLGARATTHIRPGVGPRNAGPNPAVPNDPPQASTEPSPTAPAQATTSSETGDLGPRATALSPWRTLLSNQRIMAIAGYTAITATLATFVYAEQGRIVERVGPSVAARTVALADVDVVANIVAIVLQLVLARAILSRLHGGRSLSLVPLAGIPVGIALLAAPTSSVLALFEGTRRGIHHGLGRPAKESIYADMDDQARYGARSLIETLVVRLADAAAIWLHAGIVLWLHPSAGLWALVPLSLLAVGFALGAGRGVAARG